MSDVELYLKLTSLPDHLKEEVVDFIDFLKSRLKKSGSVPPRKAGLAKGLVRMREDFEDPLDDFQEYVR